jgi:hypothetical protein
VTHDIPKLIILISAIKLIDLLQNPINMCPVIPVPKDLEISIPIGTTSNTSPKHIELEQIDLAKESDIERLQEQASHFHIVVRGQWEKKDEIQGFYLSHHDVGETAE